MSNPWATLLETHRFLPGLAKTENTKNIHNIYNAKLKAEVRELEGVGLIPSKKEFDEICFEIYQSSLEEAVKPPSDSDTRDINEIVAEADNAIKALQWHSVIAGKLICINGTIDQYLLTARSEDIIMHSLNAKKVDSSKMLLIELASSPFGETEDDKWNKKLADIATRKARVVAAEWATKELGATVTYKQSIKSKLKDYITLRLG
jgi:hypothetical protein